MFHSAERDCDIADYDQYVVKMRQDLKEAMAAAQSNALTSQERQAELYNGKMKGNVIAEGDRVLLANKENWQIGGGRPHMSLSLLTLGAILTVSGTLPMDRNALFIATCFFWVTSCQLRQKMRLRNHF